MTQWTRRQRRHAGTKRRIETELRAFATEGWPDDEAFISAGRGPLLAQIQAGGGPDALVAHDRHD